MDSSEQKAEAQAPNSRLDLVPHSNLERGQSEAVSLSSVSDVSVVPNGFNPAAWDHWLLIGVMIVFSAWVMRTSCQWRREWKQYCQERGSQALTRY